MSLLSLKNIGVAFILLLLSSCGMSSLYDENINLDNAKWFKDEAARFEVDINDTISNFDFYINLRNNTDYRYSNLYLFITTTFPNNNITRDTIECILADDTGRWLGKGWGNVKENDILLKSGLRFPLSGKYEFIIQHAMRKDTLSGIQNVGLRIENVQ